MIIGHSKYELNTHTHAPKKKHGSIEVSGKLPSYPSPKREVSVKVSLGRGRRVVSQKPKPDSSTP